MRGVLMTLGALTMALVLYVGGAIAVDVLRDGHLDGDRSQPAAPVAAAPEPQALEKRYGAPISTRPRDATAVAADPCRRALTPEQWCALNYFVDGRPLELLTGGHSCSWTELVQPGRRDGDATAPSITEGLLLTVSI